MRLLAQHKMLCATVSLLVVYAAPSFSATPESFAHNKQGIALYNQGKVKEAIEEFKTAIKLDPKDANYHRNLSKIYQGQNMMPEALAEAEAAYKAKGSDAQNVEQVASLSKVMKKYTDAEKYYRAALKLKPTSGEYYFQTLSCLRELPGKQAAYNAEVKEAAKKMPNDAGILQLYSKVLLGEKKNDEAEKAAREAVKVAPTNADAHITLAAVLQGRAKDKEAIKEYEAALKLKPDHPSAKDIKESIKYINAKVDPRIP